MNHIAQALGNANVKAFLAVIRAGEGTADQDGYRRHFGGALFDSFADHPRKAITAGLGKNQYTSTAAGAYQHLSRTWAECKAALNLPDFSPASQDLAAVFLIDRRKALQDVLDGRIEDAIRKCAREWASLPTSPYGQPVKTMEQALATYAKAGGVLRPNAPVETRIPVPVPAKEEPMAPFIAAALPALIEAAPALIRIFGESPRSEKNAKAAEVVAEIAKRATGETTVEGAVTAIATDPQAAAAYREAVQSEWYSLAESGGGGIDGARKADAAYVASGVNALRSPAFIISLVLMVFPLMLAADVFYIHPANYIGELRTQIVTGMLLCISMVGAFWLGSSFGSARKDEMQAGKGQ
jgi:muramidase (phage lysozyme)